MPKDSLTQNLALLSQSMIPRPRKDNDPKMLKFQSKSVKSGKKPMFKEFYIVTTINASKIISL